jgi:hypothetical protein
MIILRCGMEYRGVDKNSYSNYLSGKIFFLITRFSLSRSRFNKPWCRSCSKGIDNRYHPTGVAFF